MLVTSSDQPYFFQMHSTNCPNIFNSNKFKWILLKCRLWYGSCHCWEINISQTFFCNDLHWWRDFPKVRTTFTLISKTHERLPRWMICLLTLLLIEHIWMQIILLNSLSFAVIGSSLIPHHPPEKLQLTIAHS